MEKFKSLFSHSFSEQALEQIYGILDKVRFQCADEFYIILNDFKYALSMNEEGEGDIVHLGGRGKCVGKCLVFFLAPRKTGLL